MRGRHQGREGREKGRWLSGSFPVAFRRAQADNVSYDIAEAAGPDEETEAGLRCCKRGAQ